ncbi:MAG: HEAT repeat domain-containing protein [Myxococcota bacterium]|nr:HEAT repeat domain-containing protein [Myxococcota bacterium]
MSHPLLVRLKSNDPDERRAACMDAADDPSGILLADALAQTLGDPVKGVVRAASDALVAIGRRAGGVDDAIRQALHSDEPSRRWGAAFTFARLEPPGPRVLPALVEALGSPDGDVRWAAARLLVEAGRTHPEVLPLLIGLVRGGEHALVRRMATFALRELAPDRPEAAAVLLDATGDVDLHVRRAAYTAMASLMAPPPEVVEHLLRTLRGDPDAATRRLAALALGEIGAAEPQALPPRTEEALRDAGRAAEDPDLRKAVERALRRLQAGQPVPGA